MHNPVRDIWDGSHTAGAPQAVTTRDTNQSAELRAPCIWAPTQDAATR